VKLNEISRVLSYVVWKRLGKDWERIGRDLGETWERLGETWDRLARDSEECSHSP